MSFREKDWERGLAFLRDKVDDLWTADGLEDEGQDEEGYGYDAVVGRLEEATCPRMKIAKEGRQPTIIAVGGKRPVVSFCFYDVARKLCFTEHVLGEGGMRQEREIVLWRGDEPTTPSIPAQRISHVGLTWPSVVPESRETTRTMANTIVINPTVKTTPTESFCAVEIWRL
jgi:hypothetical protein